MDYANLQLDPSKYFTYDELLKKGFSKSEINDIIDESFLSSDKDVQYISYEFLYSNVREDTDWEFDVDEYLNQIITFVPEYMRLKDSPYIEQVGKKYKNLVTGGIFNEMIKAFHDADEHFEVEIALMRIDEEKTIKGKENKEKNKKYYIYVSNDILYLKEKFKQQLISSKRKYTIKEITNEIKNLLPEIYDNEIILNNFTSRFFTNLAKYNGTVPFKVRINRDDKTKEISSISFGKHKEEEIKNVETIGSLILSNVRDTREINIKPKWFEKYKKEVIKSLGHSYYTNDSKYRLKIIDKKHPHKGKIVISTYVRTFNEPIFEVKFESFVPLERKMHDIFYLKQYQVKVLDKIPIDPVKGWSSAGKLIDTPEFDKYGKRIQNYEIDTNDKELLCKFYYYKNDHNVTNENSIATEKLLEFHSNVSGRDDYKDYKEDQTIQTTSALFTYLKGRKDPFFIAIHIFKLLNYSICGFESDVYINVIEKITQEAIEIIGNKSEYYYMVSALVTRIFIGFTHGEIKINHQLEELLSRITNTNPEYFMINDINIVSKFINYIINGKVMIGNTVVYGKIITRDNPSKLSLKVAKADILRNYENFETINSVKLLMSREIINKNINEYPKRK